VWEVQTGEYKRRKDGVTEEEAWKVNWCGQTCARAEHESARQEQQRFLGHASRAWRMEAKHSKNASN